MGTAEKEITFLGKDTELDGLLVFDGALRIDGYFRGQIQSRGNLVIGEEGYVEADVHVSYLVVSGEIHGNILADQRVDLRAPGKVFGNIQAPAILMDAGVIFEGHTKMYRARDAVEGVSADDPMIGSDEYKGEPPAGLTAIFGVVTDEITGKPLKNARIWCKGHEKKRIQTNAAGYYELINLTDGEWKLKLEAQGYRKDRAKVLISGEGTYRQDFRLTPRR
ncbi:MAG: polymer-forming cytoskeletal protein [Deltaproteobacteria bacterium]|nr:polymer-forming cytoskeletal protein [Deltaproteobacteria bacterium]